MNQLPPILLVFSSLLLTSCGDGTLGYVFESELSGEYILPDGTHTVEVEVPLGSLSVVVGAEGLVKIQDGRSRIAADRAEDLEILKSLDFTLQPQAESKPGVLRLATAMLPASLNPAKTAMIMRVLLQVPPEINVELKTARGPISVIGRHADVRVHTGSGDLNFRRNQGDLEAFTGLGDILVEAHRGGLGLETREGTVIAYIDAIGAKGLQMRVQTGSINCRVPAEAAFDLDLRVEIGEGRVAYDLPVEVLGRGLRIRGEVRGGGVEVNLWSGRGGISVSPKR